MFDCRNKYKIFVGQGVARFGEKVEPGCFPVHSVETEEIAKILVDGCPIREGESLTAYAKRLVDLSHSAVAGYSGVKLSTAAPSPLGHLQAVAGARNINDVNKEAQKATNNNPILQALFKEIS